MKVLITGATGVIGGLIIQQLLKRDDITEVIALSRRPLPDSTTSPKLKTTIIEDFGALDKLPELTWEAIQDADALIWAMGTYTLNEDVNLNYPAAFQEALLKRKLANPRHSARRFRFMLLSGALVEPDQSRWLFFLWGQRRMKGLLQTRTLELAKDHQDIWEAIVIRPGGILFGGDTYLNRTVQVLLGKGMAILAEELGAAVGNLVVNGSQGALVENDELVDTGRRMMSRGT